MKLLSLTESIEILKGIGPKKKQALYQLGVKTLGDLLYYFPRRYIDRSITSSITLATGEIATLFLTVLDVYLAHGKKSRLVVATKTETNQKVSLVFFKGVAYFKNVLKPGLQIIATGKLEYYMGLQIVHPDFEAIDSSEDPEDSDLTHVGRIIPLYPTTEALRKEGLDSRGFRRLLKQCVSLFQNGNIQLLEILPMDVIRKRSLSSLSIAFKEIHFPETEATLEQAKRRFKYEEFYFFTLLLDYKRKKREEVKRTLWPLSKSKLAERVLSDLPFSLTEDQSKSIESIKGLNSVEQPMAVLLQGDVGSGKTITAVLVALHYIDNDIQVCILAPTEILARQHYNTISSFLNFAPFFKIELFLGKEKPKVRSAKLDNFKKGETLLVIGTHSLLQPDVEFKDLGLVIIDEQHKFGVEQRETLRAKGKNPDVLAMTATPIPRTLCLTVYGDLNLVVIKSKPLGRIPIVTKWFTETKRPAVYKSIHKYLDMGRQCFIIYPIIEESEKIDLQSCIDAYESLRMFEFKNHSVGLLHGKMKADEKDATMQKFKKNEIQLLITTTVVEVGIDVPNASVLVIEHADRFGISQLHQLRGRVGRGEHESFCILITGENVSDEAKVRLNAMVNTTDGFILAEEDLKLRGPGEVLGVRQSGLPDFKIADLVLDEDLLQQAKEDVQKHGSFGDLEKMEIKNRFSEGRLLFPN